MLISKIKQHKIFCITVASLFMLLMVFIGVFCAYIYPNYYKITDLDVVQDELHLIMSWDCKRTNKYEIIIFKGDEKIKTGYIGKKQCRYRLDEVEVPYTVEVRANQPFNFIGKQKKSVKTHKLEQEVILHSDSYDGFIGDTVRILGSAKSKLTYESSDIGAIMVSNTGVAKLNSKGDYDIKVVAVEDDFYKSAEATFHIKSYSDKLPTPKVKVSKSDSGKIIKWNKIDYATEYVVSKYDYWEGKYKTYKTFTDGDALEFSVNNEAAKYRVKAKGTILDKKVTSKNSKDLEIKSPYESAPTYSSQHIIKSLDVNDVECVAKIEGPSGTTCPQSFSFTGHSFVMGYANGNGSKTGFSEYDLSGKKVRSNHAKSGFANGSLYNPRNNTLYTLKRHGDLKSDKCMKFSYDDFSSVGDFTLSEIVLGMGYDATRDKIYLTNGSRLYVTDASFNVEKVYPRITAKRHTQDAGAGDGVCVLCSWNSGNDSYADLYRMSDGGYLGTYKVPIGEIESATIVDGYLYILLNNGKKYGDSIVKVKDKISL